MGKNSKRRRRNAESSDDSDCSLPDMSKTAPQQQKVVSNTELTSQHAIQVSMQGADVVEPQEVPGWDPWFKAVRNEFITLCTAASTADLMARSRYADTASVLSDDQLYAMFGLLSSDRTKNPTQRKWLISWSSTSRRMRALLRPLLLELALAVSWTGKYNAHISERLQFDSQAKIRRAIGDRVRMLKEDGNLNGIDAVRPPTKVKAVYAHGQRFTGIVEITWATLLIACDVDFCISYSETDHFGDHHIVELLEARQAPAADRLNAVYAIFG